LTVAVSPNESRGSSISGKQATRHHDAGGSLGHLEGELDACGFLRVTEKRPVMVRNLRNIFVRAGLTEQEVRTLRGVIACLTSGPRRKTQ
jgi:tRNA/rRNA methyltransferase